jgi:hypothetical protein
MQFLPLGKNYTSSPQFLGDIQQSCSVESFQPVTFFSGTECGKSAFDKS